MKRWANVIGLLLVLAFTVPAYAQGPPLPGWIREYMAGCPGCQLRLTASGWMVSRPGSFGQYLLNEAAGMAQLSGADPASGVSLVSPGNVGSAFYDPLPAQEAVNGSVQAISQRSAPYREFTPTPSFIVEMKLAARMAAQAASKVVKTPLFLLIQSPALYSLIMGTQMNACPTCTFAQ